ncbi:MAG: tyrosine-type recombinase/integrase [Fusobacteriaceae bacterium]
MQDIEATIKEYLYFLEFEQKKTVLSIGTMKSDLIQFQEFLSEREEIKTFSDITDFTIRGFINWGTEKKGLARRTVNKKVSVIRRFFKFLCDKEVIKKNPALFVEFPVFETDKPEIISLSEINEIRESIFSFDGGGVRDRAMIEILYSSGITSQELLRLGERVVDFERRELTVRGSKHSRVVFFSERAKKFLLKYLEEKKKKLGDKYDENILFANPQGKRLSDRSLRKIVGRYSQRAELEKEVTPYVFRHTFATHMLVKGMKLEFLKELLGHSSLEITRIYEELAKDEAIREKIFK